MANYKLNDNNTVTLKSGRTVAQIIGGKIFVEKRHVKGLVRFFREEVGQSQFFMIVNKMTDVTEMI